MLLHIFDSDTHETITIPQHSHLAQQLLKQDQVKTGKKDEYGDIEYYMMQAPNLIGSKGNWLLGYVGATIESGPSLFFYDLQRSKTIARIAGAELLVDCYHQSAANPNDKAQSKNEIEKSFTNAGVSHIRYIAGDSVYERSVVCLDEDSS